MWRMSWMRPLSFRPMSRRPSCPQSNIFKVRDHLCLSSNKAVKEAFVQTDSDCFPSEMWAKVNVWASNIIPEALRLVFWKGEWMPLNEINSITFRTFWGHWPDSTIAQYQQCRCSCKNQQASDFQGCRKVEVGTWEIKHVEKKKNGTINN